MYQEKPKGSDLQLLELRQKKIPTRNPILFTICNGHCVHGRKVARDCLPVRYVFRYYMAITRVGIIYTIDTYTFNHCIRINWHEKYAKHVIIIFQVKLHTNR